MEGYIILNNEYGTNDPMFVTSLACSTNKFDYRCIHTSKDLHDFYENKIDYEILVISKSKNDFRLKSIIDNLYSEKERSEAIVENSIRTLNLLSKHYE